MNYIEQYLNYLTDDKKVSKSTYSSYKHDLESFYEYLVMNEIKVEEVKRKTINTYSVFLQKNNKSTATVSRAITAIRGLYQYLHITKVMKKDPALNVSFPKAEKRLPGILSVKEVDKLLSQPDCSNYKGYRDKAMLELMYATGLRVSELISLKQENVDFKNGIIKCITDDKERIVPFGAVSSDALKKYIELSPHHSQDNGEQYLFLNLFGKKMTRQGFWKILKHYKEMSGIKSDITPQILRHSFAAHLIDNGLDIKSLQELMGYSAITSAQVYMDLSNNKIKDLYKRAHPRA